MNARRSIVLYGLAACIFFLWMSLPISWHSRSPSGSDYDTIVIVNPWIDATFGYASISFAAALLILAMIAYGRPVIRYPAVALILAIVVFPFCGFFHVVLNLGPWTMYGRVVDDAGNEYVFCDSSFLQGQVMALTRVETEGVLTTRLKVLGTNNGDWPRSWASVVRSPNSNNEYGQLYLANTRMLVGIRYGNECYLAYDLETKRFYGHGDIENVSPFICLNPTDDLRADDLIEIDNVLVNQSPDMPGYPRKDRLNDDLNNVNPKVRNAAQNMLAKHKQP